MVVNLGFQLGFVPQRAAPSPALSGWHRHPHRSKLLEIPWWVVCRILKAIRSPHHPITLRATLFVNNANSFFGKKQNFEHFFERTLGAHRVSICSSWSSQGNRLAKGSRALRNSSKFICAYLSKPYSQTSTDFDKNLRELPPICREVFFLVHLTDCKDFDTQ